MILQITEIEHGMVRISVQAHAGAHPEHYVCSFEEAKAMFTFAIGKMLEIENANLEATYPAPPPPNDV